MQQNDMETSEMDDFNAISIYDENTQEPIVEKKSFNSIPAKDSQSRKTFKKMTSADGDNRSNMALNTTFGPVSFKESTTGIAGDLLEGTRVSISPQDQPTTSKAKIRKRRHATIVIKSLRTSLPRQSKSIAIKLLKVISKGKAPVKTVLSRTRKVKTQKPRRMKRVVVKNKKRSTLNKVQKRMAPKYSRTRYSDYSFNSLDDMCSCCS
ncbi:unnamed protein product [Plutella xylostella]|uniref:(diamondback moth) hypothetical protein n=1 Tax=Plutella xylostella TaxID=51655 RepID=A0A8S4FFQ0_PLUXY|nr:unnamed protein product [Plutella xylostella]